MYNLEYRTKISEYDANVIRVEVFSNQKTFFEIDCFIDSPYSIEEEIQNWLDDNGYGDDMYEFINLNLMKTAKFITEITVIDPDSKGEVVVSIYKHENGGMFGVDSSYIEQVLDEDEETKIPDIFNYTGKNGLTLID